MPKSTKKAVEPAKKVAKPVKERKPKVSIKKATTPVAPTVQETQVVVESTAPKLPVFQGNQVVRILESGHTKTHFHCQFNGFTGHVPKSRFN